MIFKIISLVLAVIVCFLILFSREVSIEKALKERESEALKSEVKNLTIYYDHLLKTKDAEYYLMFKSLQEKSNRFEQDAIKSQRELKMERALNRKFSDAQADSLLATMR